jgi:hypothetical protein
VLAVVDSVFVVVLNEPMLLFALERPVLAVVDSVFVVVLSEPMLLFALERPVLAVVDSTAVAVESETKAAPSISASIVLSEALIALICAIVVLSEASVTATEVVKTGLTSLATVLICV